MILAQNELQPQEEVDENGNCGRLPTTDKLSVVVAQQSTLHAATTKSVSSSSI